VNAIFTQNLRCSLLNIVSGAVRPDFYPSSKLIFSVHKLMFTYERQRLSLDNICINYDKKVTVY